ncbi:MAG: Fe-S cluster assembly protein SufD [Paludibacteraceae bacterium]|nr:Fe-S cluster assembly protein SufD [Paludibacteraceae bacterium]
MVKEQYINLYQQYSQNIKNSCAPLLNSIRDEAFKRFEVLGFPAKRDKDYEYTDIASAYDHDFGINFNRVKLDENPYDVFTCDVPNIQSYLCFVVNDTFYQNPSPKTQLPKGVIVAGLNEICQTNPELVKPYLFKNMDWQNDPTQAFNATFAQDGLFIYIPKNVVVDIPIQLVNLMHGNEDMMAVNHNLIVLEEGAHVKLLMCDHASNDNKYLANRLTEIFVAKNASYEHYKIENTHNQTTNLATVLVHQADDSTFLSNTLTLHNGLTRNNIIVEVDGSNAQATVAGLAIGDKTQKMDNLVLLHHLKPYSTSSQLFKYILDDQSKGVFTGKIKIDQDAQKIVAYQTCRAICLTNTSTINVKPQLEILADDVKCSHGATVGQLDETALFYLRSRGISEPEAKMLLMYAFVNDVLEKITVESVKDKIRSLVEKRLRGELSKCNGCTVCK